MPSDSIGLSFVVCRVVLRMMKLRYRGVLGLWSVMCGFLMYFY